MSHIPNSAMPHAGPTAEAEQEGSQTLSDRAGRIADIARENPKTAIAAGAALLAGAVAAAAIPLVRSRKASAKSGSSTPRKKATTKKTTGS